MTERSGGAGATPYEAYQEFIQPIERALSCLGTVKVLASPGGMHSPHGLHSWALNRKATGMSAHGWHFVAEMRYRFVEHELGYRVRTRAYRYQLAAVGQDIWRMHWHPLGRSPVRFPHFHLGLQGPGRLDMHFPTPRVTLEHAVRWAIELGYPTSRDDWADVLSATEGPHLEHRSWSDQPPQLGGEPTSPR